MTATPPIPLELWDKTPPDAREAILALVLVFEQRIAAIVAVRSPAPIARPSRGPTRGPRPLTDSGPGFRRLRLISAPSAGWRQGLKKAWLWVAATNSVTAFLIRKHRNREAFDDLVGPSPGVLTTDRYSVYTHLKTDKRLVCWAHLRRDFQAMIDRQDQGSPIGVDLLMHADLLAER